MIAVARAKACFVRACELDVAVRKPGNVSRASSGHGMHAELFVASARASAGPLFEGGARVGERIEAAVVASWAVAGCNTNLGILLLCAPIALAVEQRPEASTPAALRAAIESVLSELDLADAQAAYRAIAPAKVCARRRASICAPRWRSRQRATASRVNTAMAMPICSRLRRQRSAKGFHSWKRLTTPQRTRARRRPYSACTWRCSAVSPIHTLFGFTASRWHTLS
jgi:triphosphoribosyl-dephospho-CoA synthetase